MKILKDTSLENLKILFQNFFDKFGHYPTQYEINEHLGISSKTLQRKYGSLKTLRSLLDLKVLDFTTGEERVKKVKYSLDLSFKEQKKMYKKLVPIFGKYYIHSQSPFGDESRQRSDFKIHHKEGDFYVDIFHASSYQNMTGCINAKLKKYDPKLIWGKIILINTNKKLDDVIFKMICQRKNKLPSNIDIMSEEEFYKFCQKLNPIV